jgi:hypothetical protein
MGCFFQFNITRACAHSYKRTDAQERACILENIDLALDWQPIWWFQECQGYKLKIVCMFLRTQVCSCVCAFLHTALSFFQPSTFCECPYQKNNCLKIQRFARMYIEKFSLNAFK